MRMASAALGLLVLLSACGPVAPAEPPPRELAEAAGKAARDGRWDDAAVLFGRAFALEDPVPARRPARAFLALRRAWALARQGMAEDALLWLRWAERLDEENHVIHFERALLYDGSHPATRDPTRARASYERFLEGHRAAGEPPPEADMAAEAQKRVKALSR